MCSNNQQVTGFRDVQPAYVYESNIHSHCILATLNEQRKLGVLCDMTVIVEGVELKAHKAVLAACSSYFDGIITDPANVRHNIVLELSSISKVGMEKLLEFAYTSKLTVSRDDIDQVLSAARELDIKNLEYSCLNVLKQKLLQDTPASQCKSFSSKNLTACRNSTISRKLICTSGIEEGISMKQDGPQSCLEKPETIHPMENSITDSRISKDDCPLIANLSLNPKPQNSVKYDLKCVLGQNTQEVKSVCQPLFATTVYPIQKLECQTMPPKRCAPSSAESYVKFAPICPVSSPATRFHGCDSQPKVACPSSEPVFTCPYAESSDGKKYLFSQAMYNSDTDDALSADDDGDRNYKCVLSSSSNSMVCINTRKHPGVVLPFTIEEITRLPRTELQELLNKHPELNVQQISAMHEIRRRGKNRIAAQRCRKRKMDCIRALQCELDHLHKDYNRLMNERHSVQESAYQLAELYQQRYQQLFANCVKDCGEGLLDEKPCEKNTSDDGAALSSDKTTNNMVASMAEHFQNEVKEVVHIADRIRKIPCEYLPPFAWTCSLFSKSEVSVMCDDEDSLSGSCYQACNPSAYPNVTYSPELAACQDQLQMKDAPCSKVVTEVERCNVEVDPQKMCPQAEERFLKQDPIQMDLCKDEELTAGVASSSKET